MNPLRELLHESWLLFLTMLDWITSSLMWIVEGAESRNRREWKKKMNESKTYKEWYQFAMQYSNSYGYYEWRRSTNDKHFDYVEIQHRTKGIRTLINEIEKATEAGNTQQADDYFSNLQTHLRFDLTRGPCKILRPEAFKYCIGTKKVIEEYIEQIQKSLEFISEYQSASLLDRYHYLSACLKTHGHTALLLSGGQSLSLYHLGVCRFLHDMNFLPRVICGTGTAAIIASFVCCNHDRELKLLLDASQEKLDFSPFTNKRQQGGLIARCGRRLRRLCEEGTLMDINVVAEFVEHHLGDTTFAEAFKKTGRVLNIVICNLNECQTILPHTDYTIPQPLIGGGETRWVANYLTAPDVLIRTAAVAAVSQGILASMLWKGYCLKRKNPSTGEVEVFSPCAYVSTKETAEALAIQRLSEQFNVTCIMRAKTKLRLWQSGACASSVLSKPHKSWLRLHTERAIHEVLHEGLYRTHKLLKWLRRVPILGTTSKRLLSLDIFLKDVDVDIELSSYEGFTLRMLEHPSRSLVTKGLHDGERSIWPRLSNIQLHLAVEDSFNLVLSRLLEKIQTESAKEQESSIGPVVIIPDFPFPQTFRTGKYVHRNPTLSLIPFPMADEEVLSDGGSSVESNRYHEYGAGFGSMIMRHVSRRRGSGASEHHHDKVAWSDE